MREMMMIVLRAMMTEIIVLSKMRDLRKKTTLG
jgi:hypothetical protein